jgi:uncharacterized membrane protein
VAGLAAAASVGVEAVSAAAVLRGNGDMNLTRLLKHWMMPAWRVRLAFPPKVLDAIEAAVAQAEAAHRGEIRFAVEGALPPAALWQGQSPRDRAIDVFSALRVWDTELNTGVLVYVQVADRAVEIVADRGINAKVKPEEWNAICADMQRAFGAGRFEEGAVAGLKAIAVLLRSHFAAPAANPNELPNRPVML